MRFAHLADVHIGAWRDPAMKGMSLAALRQAVDLIIARGVDFTIIAGDLFNTAVPAIDHLQETVILLKKLKVAGIPVYVVPGSHDYSAAGKTILDVLEETELMINVMKGKVSDEKLLLKFTQDKKTGVYLTGIGGRRGSLEMKEYAKLDLGSLESHLGKKVFLFHTSIDELKPDEMYAMLSVSISEFPQGFEYYAGGHVHIVDKNDFEGRQNVVYPGPIFPANFHELWSLGRGGFYFYEDGSMEYQPIEIRPSVNVEVKADGKSPEEVFKDLEAKMNSKKQGFDGAIVLIRVHGKLKSGKPSDIDFRNIFQEAYNTGAYFVMRSTTQLTSDEFLLSKISSGSADEIEDRAISDYLSSEKAPKSQSHARIKALMKALSDEQNDGEKKYSYDERIKKDAEKILD